MLISKTCIKYLVPKIPERIDIQVEVQPVEIDTLSSRAPAESSASIRQRVIEAREIQKERFKDFKGVHCNAQMTTAMMHQFAEPEPKALARLKETMESLSMSARAYDRILKVARTIADLDQSTAIKTDHIMEAIGYRNLDRSSYFNM